MSDSSAELNFQAVPTIPVKNINIALNRPEEDTSDDVVGRSNSWLDGLRRQVSMATFSTVSLIGGIIHAHADSPVVSNGAAMLAAASFVKVGANLVREFKSEDANRNG